MSFNLVILPSYSGPGRMVLPKKKLLGKRLYKGTTRLKGNLNKDGKTEMSGGPEIVRNQSCNHEGSGSITNHIHGGRR